MGERIKPGIYSLETADGFAKVYIQKGEVLGGADIWNASRLPDEPPAELASPYARFEQFLNQFEPASDRTVKEYRRKWNLYQQKYGDNHFMSPIPQDLDRGFPAITFVTNALIRARVETIDDLLKLKETDFLSLRRMGKKYSELFTIMQDLARAKIALSVMENDES